MPCGPACEARRSSAEVADLEARPAQSESRRVTRLSRNGADRPANVLFLCTFNAARSIMAEAILASVGQGRFRAHSAGDQAVGRIHPLTFDTLERHGVATTGLRSKSWERFFGLAAPPLDFLIIVCDDSYEDLLWPSEGQLVQAYWATPNPMTEGADEGAMRASFEAVYASLERRIRAFVELPRHEMTAAELWHAVMRVGAL